LGYTLSSEATSVTARFSTAAATLFERFTGFRQPAAIMNLSGTEWMIWEATGSRTYTLKVVAADANQKVIDSSTYVFGKVQSVRYKSTGTVFVIVIRKCCLRISRKYQEVNGNVRQHH